VKNNFKVFPRKKTKGHKQESKNLVMSPMSAGGEP
jgi:hypothetical protein